MDSNAESLGTLRQEFKPKLSNVVAGSIIGLVLLVGGISLAVFMIRRPDTRQLETGDKIAKYGFIAFAGILGPLGGFGLLYWMKQLASHRVSVHENGFSYAYGGENELCHWSDVTKVSEVFTEEELKVLKVPGAKIKNLDRSFVVHRKDGKTFNFSVNSIDSMRRFADLLKQASRKHNIAWEQVHQ
jgi:hypothetical protein